MMICYCCCCRRSYYCCSTPLTRTPIVVATSARNAIVSFRIAATYSQLVANFFVGQKNPQSSKVVWLEDKMMKGGNGWLLQQQEQRYTLLPHCCYSLPALASFFVGQKNPHSSKVAWLEEKMMKGENGSLLQQEDGESQNTFIWIGWMTRQMDGWKKLHDHDVLYI